MHRWLDVKKRKEGIIALLTIKYHNAPLDSTVRNARKTSHYIVYTVVKHTSPNKEKVMIRKGKTHQQV